MDREYLEDYEQKESSEFERLKKRMQEGQFDLEKDRYPSDGRFMHLRKPVALTTLGTSHWDNLWTQIPFSGSLILLLPPVTVSDFEKFYFNVSEIPEIIDFIKDTGRLQIALSANPLAYDGLDYLDPFFQELNPPIYAAAPDSVLHNEKEIQKAIETFYTLGKVKYLSYLRESFRWFGLGIFRIALSKDLGTFITLKLGRYSFIDDIENLMVDDPEKAFLMLSVSEAFIDQPLRDLRSNMRNYTLEEIRAAQNLPLVNQPKEIRFPVEIGKFLLRKLTYAPQGRRACYDLMDRYDAYDLGKVQESLNEAIVTNHPETVNKSSEELSEILDNIWDDPTIPKRVKGLKVGAVLSVAGIGGIAAGLFAGPIGVVAGGFLANLGFQVADKVFDGKVTGLSEKLAKLHGRSYQVNIYDFRRKYKSGLATEFASGKAGARARRALRRAVQKSEEIVLESATIIAKSKGHTEITDEDLEEAIEKERGSRE